MQLAAAPPQSDNSSVLYSDMSGEEILQQWLTKHPEVTKKYQDIRTEAEQHKRDTSLSESLPKTPTPNPLLNSTPSVSGVQGLPPELEPYREVLPPSLLPPALRTQFPGYSGVTNWTDC